MAKNKIIQENACIGIISAIHEEYLHLKAALNNCKTHKIAHKDFIEGDLHEKKIILSLCGMGKVGAAISAQILIDYFHPNMIINAGSAGALSNDLNIGDVVIATSAVQWDVDTTDLGDPRGFITGINKIQFNCCEDIYNKLYSIINKGHTTVKGLIASGDQFVSTPEQRNEILKFFPEAVCAEMEGAAIGHVCVQNDVPYAIIRCISDNANHDSQINFNKFVKEAGKETYKYIDNFIKNL